MAFDTIKMAEFEKKNHCTVITLNETPKTKCTKVLSQFEMITKAGCIRY